MFKWRNQPASRNQALSETNRVLRPGGESSTAGDVAVFVAWLGLAIVVAILAGIFG